MTMTETPAVVAGYPLAEIVAAYVECALWADEVYGPGDIDADSMALIEADVLTFARQAWHVAEAAGWSAGQFGHDYFLTRNGHGAGFWCREWDADGRGDYLTRLAKAMGEWELTVCDGKVVAE